MTAEHKNHAPETRLERLKSEMSLRRSGKNRVLIAVLILAVSCGVWCAWNIAKISIEDCRDERRMLHLQAAAGVCEEDSDAAEETYADTAEDPGINMSAVIDEAPAACAWITVPGTRVQYPVMQAEDNEYYLSHAPDGSPSRAGSVFMNCGNTEDFMDRNTVLYGHRMNSGAMFGQLSRFTDREFFAEHPWIFITMPDGTVYAYSIVCVQEIRADLSEAEYRTSFSGDADFVSWRSRPRSGVICAREAEFAERYLTLSTCIKGRPDARLVLQAGLVSESRRENI